MLFSSSSRSFVAAAAIYVTDDDDATHAPIRKSQENEKQ